VDDSAPRLYSDLANWFHLLTRPEDYSEEAEMFTRYLIEASDKPPRAVLELGSGGGNNAFHMKRRFEMTLTDISSDMLDLSRTINPDLEHVQGDMRTLRLGREFDAVFVHDAVTYMATEADLRAAIETAYVHTRPGGIALFVPDDLRETFEPRTEQGGHDGDDGRAIRYLEWEWDPDPSDTMCQVDFAYMLREADGTVRVEHDRHIHGLFSRDFWHGTLREAGFDAASSAFKHSEVERPIDVFIAKRPA
jgi:SAM-dependent methyltransferase